MPSYDATMLAGLDRAYADPRFAASAMARATPGQLATLAGNGAIMRHQVLGPMIRERMASEGNPYMGDEESGGMPTSTLNPQGIGNIASDALLEESMFAEPIRRIGEDRSGEGEGVTVPISGPHLPGQSPTFQERATPAMGALAPTAPPPIPLGGQHAIVPDAAIPPNAPVQGLPWQTPGISPGLAPAGTMAPHQPQGALGGAATPPIAPPDPSTPQGLDFGQMLMHGGLQMMMAGGQPGQNVLGALGHGVMGALQADQAAKAAQAAAAQQAFENQMAQGQMDLRRQQVEAQMRQADAAGRRVDLGAREMVTLANGNVGILDIGTGQIMDTGQKMHVGALSQNKLPADLQTLQFLEANPQLQDLYNEMKGRNVNPRIMAELYTKNLDQIMKAAENPLSKYNDMTPAELEAVAQAQTRQAIAFAERLAAGGGSGEGILTVPIPGDQQPTVITDDDGKSHQYIGGDPNDPDSWEEIE